MVQTHLIDDCKPIDPGTLDVPDDCAEEVCGIFKKVRRAIEEYLGNEQVVDIPISAPRYYCDLAAHSLERQREVGGWRTEQVLGRIGSQARHASVSVAPDKEEVLLQAGILFLRKQDVRLALNVDLDPTEKADVVVSVAVGQRRHGAPSSRTPRAFWSGHRGLNLTAYRLGAGYCSPGGQARARPLSARC